METMLQIIGAVLFFIGSFHSLFLIRGGIQFNSFPTIILISGAFLFILGSLIKLVKQK
jgi:hypothetical protein